MSIALVLVIGDESVLPGQLTHGGEVCGNGASVDFLVLIAHFLCDFLDDKFHKHFLHLCLTLLILKRITI
jgi:hypothetical protein